VKGKRLSPAHYLFSAFRIPTSEFVFLIPAQYPRRFQLLMVGKAHPTQIMMESTIDIFRVEGFIRGKTTSSASVQSIYSEESFYTDYDECALEIAKPAPVHQFLCLYNEANGNFRWVGWVEVRYPTSTISCRIIVGQALCRQAKITISFEHFHKQESFGLSSGLWHFPHAPLLQ
jgi:hypothetical protein